MNTNQFNRCIDAHSDGVYRLALGIVHDRETGRDIVQESFARLWENRKKVERGKEKSLLFTIAYNLAISHYRRNIRHQRVDIDNYSTTSLSYNHDYDNRTEILWDELDKLPPVARTLIMLRDWEGYSYGEIASIMELSEGQVKIGIHRTRQTLQKRLKIHFDE